MKFSLIICTYQRPEALWELLDSVEKQSLVPDQILVVDGSSGDETEKAFYSKNLNRAKYFHVGEMDRGLTKQRNFGISKVEPDTEIVCFLDDDIILTPAYFQKLINTYLIYPEALGVGGYIIDEVNWKKVGEPHKKSQFDFVIDGYVRRDSSRFILRKKLGLLEECFPTIMPKAAHGRSVGFLPPSNKTYEVETFMGGVSSFRKKVLENNRFSDYFEGYGLYEDTDFTLRLSKIGKLYLNTEAKLYHYHEEKGRPNHFLYGKMVVRNGWYVWRVKYPYPGFRYRLNWNLITFLLILIRVSNIFNTNERKQALTETMGRIVGWLSLFFNKPSIRNDS